MALESRIAEAVDYALLHGLIKYTSQGHLSHAPFTMTPSPLPARLIAQLKRLSPHFNALAHRVSLDLEFLKEALGAAAVQDDFVRRLLDTAGDNQRQQPLRLLVSRSDYFMQPGKDGSGLRPIQVELNTISAAYAGLAEKVFLLHRYLHHGTENGERLVPNAPAEGIADGFAEAHRRYGVADAVCLVVIQPGERNIFDQRLIEFALNQRGIQCRRMSLEAIAQSGSLREGHLVVDSEIAAITYFRAGYGPEDYSSPSAFEARALIESSSTVAVPDVAMQLAGAKKVQQLLTDPAILRRYCDESDAAVMSESFAGIFEPGAELETAHGVLPAWQAACAEPSRYVLKPQREGGGNNLYDDDMAAALERMTPEQREAYILMERIYSQPHEAVTVMEGTVHRGAHVSEIGRFGVLLAQGDDIVVNRDVGYLVRTKGESSLESGVSAGFGHLDSLMAIPDQ